MIQRSIEMWRSSEVLGQLVRFGITGVGVTLLYAAIYYPLATYVMHPNLAVTIAFLISAAVGRVVHERFSFRGHGRRDNPGRMTRRFLVVQLTGFLLNMGFTWVLVTGPYLHGPTWWPLIPTTFVTPLITFFLNRMWAFA